jgi:hypothetical protein
MASCQLATLYLDQSLNGLLFLKKADFRVGIIHARRRLMQLSAVGGECGSLREEQAKA